MVKNSPYPNLFTPINIGQLQIGNRIVMTPVGTRLARDGQVTEAFKAFYTIRARGGVGLIILEPCFIEPEGEGMFLSLHEDSFVAGLEELVDSVHTEGALIGVQLFHAGWRPGTKNARFLPPIPPHELSVERITDLVNKFGQAARRAKTAGFDLIEIHAAHGYLLSQFLSPLGNQRTDDYGGDAGNRSRIVRDIITSIRNETGPDFPLSSRINGSENVSGGTTLADAKETAALLEKEGLDLISVSAGALGSYPLTIPPSDTPHGCYVNLAKGVKQVVSIPVLTAGRINSPDLAEDILGSGKADLAAMARGLVADPDLPQKALRGDSHRIRKCIACNTCLDADFEGHLSCTVNPLAGRETELEINPTEHTKKVVIVGSGLAGLEAARVIALRGHAVTIYEETSDIGGQWNLAAIPSHKQEFYELLNWLSSELQSLYVNIITNCRITMEEISDLNPDVVIIATGAEPIIPKIPGYDGDNVVTAWEALKHPPEGSRVLVIGGGATGLETAEFLAKQGKKVSVVEMLKKYGSDIGETVYFHLRNRIANLGIDLIRNTEVREISNSQVIVLQDTVEKQWKPFDAYVLALGVKSRNKLANTLKNKVKELYVIGDASAPSNAANAMRQGFEIGIRI